MIDQITIDRITDTARIEDIVSDYVTLKKRGVNLLGLCPFHNEKTPSFIVSPAKGIFKCFGCGKGGNSVHFVMEHEQISYYEALKFLARKYNIEIQERELSPEEEAARNDRESMFLVNEYAQKYFQNNLHNHIDGKAIGLAYFRERGFRDDIIQKFQLGYSLDQRDAFTQAATKGGYNKNFLVKTGLTLENENGYLSDRFRGRVMFPVHSLSGKVIAFGGRILKKDDKMAKYVNSPESEIYHKSNELYGIYLAKQAIVKHDRCFLVEGYTDVISMHQSGIENVVASSGTSLTPGQIRLIHRFTDNVTVIYDGDAAGIKASIRGIDLLLEEGLNIKVLLLPDGDDPDSFARKHNASDFIEFVEKNSTDFLRFKTNLLLADAGNDPIKRAGLVLDIVRSIAIIPNQLIRAEYVKECSALLQVEEDSIYNEINKLKGNERLKLATRQQSAAANETPTQAQTNTFNNHSIFDQQEKEILRMLLRYGTSILYYENGETEEEAFPVSVSDYIFEELAQDHLEFQNVLYQKAVNEYKVHENDNGFQPDKYFINLSDVELSGLAIDILEEKYVLSKIFTKAPPQKTEIKKQQETLATINKNEAENDPEKARLIETVPRIIFEYKNSIVLNTIKQKILDLKSYSEARDYEKANVIMAEISELEIVKNALASSLGERVITKI